MSLTTNIPRRITPNAVRFECARPGCQNEVETAIGHDAIQWASDQFRRFPAACNACVGERR